MAPWNRQRSLPLALLIVAAALSACSLYKDVKELVHSAKEKVEEKPQSPKQAEPPHEGPLLDNKVTALRVQEALKQAGAGFEQVEVNGSAAGVTLSGTVKSAAERTRAEEIARSVHRGMQLKNEIRVGK